MQLVAKCQMQLLKQVGKIPDASTKSVSQGTGGSDNKKMKYILGDKILRLEKTLNIFFTEEKNHD